MEKEFNLSKKIFGVRQGFVAYKEDIKEFIKRDAELIDDFYHGKIPFSVLIMERNKLIGDDLKLKRRRKLEEDGKN